MSALGQNRGASEPLDLVDVALLLTYERTTTEPRLRHAKLREITHPSKPTNKGSLKQMFGGGGNRPQITFTFDRLAQTGESIDMSSPPDLPSNILPSDLAPSDKLNTLGPRELETIFHQARGHDCCRKCLALLQHFFDLFPGDTPLRVRHQPKGNTPGLAYTTRIDNRKIIEQTLFGPRQTTNAVLLPENTTYSSGEADNMSYAVVWFSPPNPNEAASILDLSSMQFGDVGRAKGQGLFALETLDEYYDRMDKVAQGNVIESLTISMRVLPSPDDEWLKLVAKRAKERWERRDVEEWCGHCGAPVSATTTKCGACRATAVLEESASEDGSAAS